MPLGVIHCRRFQPIHLSNPETAETRAKQFVPLSDGALELLRSSGSEGLIKGERHRVDARIMNCLLVSVQELESNPHKGHVSNMDRSGLPTSAAF